MREPIILTPNSTSILHLKSCDKRLAKVIQEVGIISYVPHEDGYSFLIHEIIEQMLSIKAGAVIYGRFIDLCGGDIIPERVESLSIEQIQSVGISAAKANYIKILTNAINSNDLDLAMLETQSDAFVIQKLTSYRGIGNWTAKMYLIFVLDRPDILPFEDGAFLQSFRWLYKTNECSPSAVIKKCKKWSPYSSIAARYMYRALDSGLTRYAFHLYKPLERG